MKTRIQLLFAIGLVTFATAAFAADTGITATGKGEVWAKPDRATVNMAVEAQSDDLGDARAHVNRVSGKVLKIVDGLGISRKRVNSAQPSIVPQYSRNDDTHERKLTGYRVKRQITVRLKDLSRLEDLIQRAADAGVNRISPPALHSSNAEQLRQQALASAAKNARANAEAMVRALDAHLGKVLYLNASRTTPRPQPRMFAMARAKTSSNNPSTYATGQIRVQVKVTARFAVEQ